MNERHNSRHSAPEPLCAALEPLLPLLSLGELEPDETAHVREHVATCTYCGSLLVEFDTIRDALRRYQPSVGAPEMLVSLEAILDAADGAGGEEERAEEQTEVPPPHVRHGTLPPFPAATWRRGRARLSALGALAAVLLLAVLATAIFGWLRPSSEGVTVPGLGTLTVFRLPVSHSQPRFIVAGRDGNLWFTENGRIGRLTPQGAITEFSLPGGVTLNGLAAGPDGTIWFTDGDGKIGRLSPRTARATEFALPDSKTPGTIVAGPDGNLWFFAANLSPNSTEQQQTEIGRITPQGQITIFPLPTGAISPASLAAGPDGKVWFAVCSDSSGADVVTRMSRTGAIKVFPVPCLNVDLTLTVITVGPDGNLWYAHTHFNQIGRITPQGAIAVFPVSGSGVGGPISVGPDGNLWFVVGDEHTLGRITPQGAITEFPLPAGVTLGDITRGPDGALWFTDTVANTIDRIALHR